MLGNSVPYGNPDSAPSEPNPETHNKELGA
jgi:hypothetical protein